MHHPPYRYIVAIVDVGTLGIYRAAAIVAARNDNPLDIAAPGYRAYRNRLSMFP